MVERIGHHFADEGKQAGAGPAPEAEHQFRDLLYKAEEERIGVAFPEGISPFRGGKVMVGRGDDEIIKQALDLPHEPDERQGHDVGAAELREGARAAVIGWKR